MAALIRKALRLLSRHVWWNRVICFGDSHLGVFRKSFLKRTFPFSKFDVVSVGGATISGLSNPNSTTNALNIFAEKAESLCENDIIIINLGEVDLGFVIWWKCIYRGMNFEEIYKNTVENYRKMITAFSKCRLVVVVSAPLPSIRDNDTLGEVANARKEVTVSQSERTLATVRFNREISEESNFPNNVIFVNLDESSIDQETGIVHERLLSLDPLDHHYSHEAYSEILLPAVRKAIGLSCFLPNRWFRGKKSNIQLLQNLSINEC